MTSDAAQTLVAQAFGPRGRASGRRPVPAVCQRRCARRVHHRWRERPRCPGPRVAPGHPGGVVHAIAGAVLDRAPWGSFVGRIRAARVSRTPLRSCSAIGTDVEPLCAVTSSPTWGQIETVCRACRGGARIACSRLAPCSRSSRLSAPRRPGHRPGLRALTTAARGTSQHLRDARDSRWSKGEQITIDDGRSSGVDCPSSVGAARHLLRVAPSAHGARFPSSPPRHDASASPTTSPAVASCHAVVHAASAGPGDHLHARRCLAMQTWRRRVASIEALVVHASVDAPHCDGRASCAPSPRGAHASAV